MKSGDCYEAAASFIMDHCDDPLADELVLVHATVAGQGELTGRWIGHAWVENRTTGFAIDTSNGRWVILPIDVYRAIGQAKEVHEHAAKDVRSLILQHRHWGPWLVTLDSDICSECGEALVDPGSGVRQCPMCELGWH